jgi:hypothetical protein
MKPKTLKNPRRAEGICDFDNLILKLLDKLEKAKIEDPKNFEDHYKNINTFLEVESWFEARKLSNGLLRNLSDGGSGLDLETTEERVRAAERRLLIGERRGEVVSKCVEAARNLVNFTGTEEWHFFAVELGEDINRVSEVIDVSLFRQLSVVRFNDKNQGIIKGPNWIFPWMSKKYILAHVQKIEWNPEGSFEEFLKNGGAADSINAAFQLWQPESEYNLYYSYTTALETVLKIWRGRDLQESLN